MTRNSVRNKNRTMSKVMEMKIRLIRTPKIKNRIQILVIIGLRNFRLINIHESAKENFANDERAANGFIKRSHDTKGD